MLARWSLLGLKTSELRLPAVFFLACLPLIFLDMTLPL
jgi:hypothetical protein